MKNPFEISFRKELPDLNKNEIINLFLINLKGSLYKKVEKKKNGKLIIKGEFYSIDPMKRVPWNLWTGFSRKAELYFPKDNLVVYSIDFKYGIISIIIGFSFFLAFPLLFSFKFYNFYLIILGVVLSVLLLSFLIKLLLHRQLFYKTMRLENRFKGNYDWYEIFKNKSNSELNKIVYGNTALTEEVQKLAKEELKRRKTI